ncbi:MAG: hypothetical protein Q8O42_14050 [Acidobacteriota bacterium]|nr:hypothetical protein [Acidobacteriota bacterium]
MTGPGAAARFWRTAPWHFAGVLAVLTVVAWLAPAPFPTDQQMMEKVGQGVIVPGCADLNCFRVLVPAAIESLPGPALERWRAYAVLSNAASGIAAGRLALALGLAPPAVTLTIWLSALGAGSFSTVYHPFNADPLVLFLAPVTTLLLLRGRNGAAGVLAGIGIFAKEFAAAPLYIGAAAAALQREWSIFGRRLALAVAVTALWVALQLSLMFAFNYSYNDNPSSQPMAGGYLRVWLSHMTPATAAFGLFGAFGAVHLLLPLGWKLAPPALRALCLGAIPAVLAFVYVATPERALWNFYFLAIPVGAIVLAHVPPALSWVFVAAFTFANFRIGAQMTQVPASRYALAVSIAIALFAVVRAWRAPRLAPELTVATT